MNYILSNIYLFVYIYIYIYIYCEFLSFISKRLKLENLNLKFVKGITFKKSISSSWSKLLPGANL